MTDKLAQAYKKELQSEITNPLKAAIKLMNLNEDEIEKWLKVFQKIDKKKLGKVALDDVFEYFEETPTAYAKEVFNTLDSTDHKGLLEFGDFVLAVGTYCFYGKNEIIKYYNNLFYSTIY